MVVDVVIAEGNRDFNKSLADIIGKDSNLNIKGQALTGLETISHVMRQRPQVLIMSTNLPDLDLVSIIKRVMRQYPTPMLILHERSEHEVINKVRKMDIGIIDFLPITQTGTFYSINEVSLTTRIHILSKLNIQRFTAQIKQGIKMTRDRQKRTSRLLNMDSREERTALTTRPISSRVVQYSGTGRSSRIVIIGSSTGGPRLLSELVPKFPKNLPPVVIVQHMPVGFISAFAKRLNRMSRIRVVEAKAGDAVMPGTVYLAPGGRHLEFTQISGGIPKIMLTDGPTVNFVKPAVDVTLFSAVKTYGHGVISVILTGMGSDGRDGSSEVKTIGGIVLALNEEDSDIYGMNRAVIEADLADDILGKKDIVLGIIRAIEGKI